MEIHVASLSNPTFNVLGDDSSLDLDQVAHACRFLPAVKPAFAQSISHNDNFLPVNDTEEDHLVAAHEQKLPELATASALTVLPPALAAWRMASIFTYDPDPPRVSSPWLAPDDPAELGKISRDSGSPASSLSQYRLTKLQAEPQEGPTEYKLHLLLRPRRAYTSMSTVEQRRASLQPATGSHNAKLPALNSPAASHQSRQERLKHLTTQLLWRLQQSSPYHATSSKESAVVKLAQDSIDPNSPVKLEPLVPGLEESRGALYEIGVSDDGTLIGLTKDEMSESLATLRAMAASLGCLVDVVRMVVVGDCEWEESADAPGDADRAVPLVPSKGELWVAEALVTPSLGIQQEPSTGEVGQRSAGAAWHTPTSAEAVALPSRGSSATPQLRITLTGPTTSGKSSLLGTLSTGTLDNGRGKSRLSLLKHRHEMVSGVTSSIAQELIGYRDDAILNFAQGNIESWVDIHDRAENGRLVFLSDSGGHPRYRRTVLRGLMNWAPHWSILCIAGDAAETVAVAGSDFTGPPGRDALGGAAAGIDLVRAHLNLVLKLEVPMAIVITKLDLASRHSLQKTMVKVLAAVKDAGRVPKILQPDQVQHADLRRIPPADLSKADSFVETLSRSGSSTSHVPIVLTSAVKGTGIGLLHALLAKLPLPPPPTSRDYVGMALNPEQPRSLFHVDDTFSLPSSYCAMATGPRGPADRGVVVSGHVRFGSLSVGDGIVVGPFQPEDDESRGARMAVADRPSPGGYGLSISHPSSSELTRMLANACVPASTVPGEWHSAQIVSIRNLRLAVRTLEAGQAGSVGIAFGASADGGAGSVSAENLRVRRGMVLAIPSSHMLDTRLSLQAASGFTAVFHDPAMQSLAAGSFVNVYVASVRASARILRILGHRPGPDATAGANDVEDVLGLGADVDNVESSGEDAGEWLGEVTLELLHNREWIEMGSKVMMLEGGSQDRSGLEGYVGKVIEIVE